MITRNRILFAIGVWTALLPFLGFPSSYEMFFTIASGLAVAICAFFYARDKRMTDVHAHSSRIRAHEVSAGTFAESRPQPEMSSRMSPAASSTETHDERYTDLKSIISRSKNF